MSYHEWPATDYAVGSFIQATVASEHLNQLMMKPNDKVLDVGCGNGEFSKKILDKVPKGSVLGIDASENMLQLAREISRSYPNFSIQQADVLSMSFVDEFDYVVSFWCLQWSKDIYQAFNHIFKALKKGGKLFALFPVGNDPYIMTYYALKESGRFSSLEKFKPPVDYSRFNHLEEQLASIPFHQLEIKQCKHQLILPSLDTFRKFVNGIAFYQKQLAEGEVKELNEAMVRHYEEECRQKYHGEYQFNASVYLIAGEK